MTVVIHLITVIEWELFRKYHIKQCVFRDDVSKTKNILSFHRAWAGKRALVCPGVYDLLNGR